MEVRRSFSVKLQSYLKKSIFQSPFIELESFTVLKAYQILKLYDNRWYADINYPFNQTQSTR